GAVVTRPGEGRVRGRRPVAPEGLAAVEEALIAADVGLPAVEEAMEALRAGSGAIAEGGRPAMRRLLREQFRTALERRSSVVPFSSRPWIVFAVGVNGVGKTTTLGKLAQAWKGEGRTS